MLWVKSLHIIFMVTWFAGLFYLPRLFVYHASSEDQISHDRFKIMERKLFYGITTPGGVLATAFGLWLMAYDMSAYMQQGWMHAKLSLVLLTWIYHIFCGYYVIVFKHDRNTHSHVFYRWFNEIPILFLFAIVILVVVKPF